MNFEEVFDFGRDFEALSRILDNVRNPFFFIIEIERKAKKRLELINTLTTQIINLLERLLDFLERNKVLPIIKEEVTNVIEAERNILGINDQTKSFEELSWVNSELSKVFLIWEDRILSDLGEMRFLEVLSETNLNPEKLSCGAQSFFDDTIWGNFSKIEQEDLIDGCRCLSLQAWSPSAMITVRAIEAALRLYYHRITGSDSTKKAWMILLRELRGHKDSDKILLGYFNYLNKIRNKLQHPEARFTQSEAEDIFNHAIHVMNLIHKI